MENKNDKTTGFSLVEFIIYLAIFSGVVVVLITLLFSTIRGRGDVQTKTEVQQNMRYALSLITQTIHSATAIDGTPGASLCLTMSDNAKNPTEFDVSNGTLRITEGSGGGSCPPSGTATPITSEKVTVTNLTFTKISNPAPAKDTIQVNLTIEYKDQGNPQLKFSQNQVTTVSLKQ